jgi:cytochrome d ubiquinol oxidase subunit I
MDLDVQFLSRLQFALTIMFHYLFPPLSIGLGLVMVLMEGSYLATGNPAYHNMTKFWSRLFAVNFAMGVATGIPMEFQFGTNWAAYARYVGDVFGSALAAEGIFAFFLESGFLAVLVFGWDRVSKKMHFIATLMVFLGSVFSSVWIVVANSWMHTPAGYALAAEAGGKEVAVITDFWAMVFNPSSVNRLCHVLLGCFAQGSFFVMSISAFYLLRSRHTDFAQRSFKIALCVALATMLLFPLSGHFQARGTAEHNPAKLAALEGHFRTGEGGTPLYLVGLPDEETERVNHGIAVPGMLSFLVHDDFNKPVTGLDKFRKEDRPPVVVTFLAYHTMLGAGMSLLPLTLLAAFFWWRGTLFARRWLLWVFVGAVALPYIANQAGWTATEVGRQPFVVYPKMTTQSDGSIKMEGGLRTAKGLSNTKVVEADQVWTSMVFFGLVYGLLFAVWVYVLDSKIRHGPDELPETPPAETGPTDILAAAARRKESGTYSLTTTESRDH